jgi:endonuclease III
MQANLFSSPAGDIHILRDRLRPVFGRIRPTDRLEAIDQFVRSFIGSKTYDDVSWKAFWRMARHFRSWDALADAPVEEIEAQLKGVTHAEKKAPELKRALRKIRVRAGVLDLHFLVDHPVEQALRWLEEIDGVGRKIAACTLNFSVLGMRAFVVDTHVLRVLRRFGFVDARAEPAEVHDAVMEAVADFDADDLYELHWYLKRLGQKTCTAYRAHCVSCPLSDVCLRRVEAGAVAVTRASARVA